MSTKSRGLLGVERLLIPQARMDETMEALRYAGEYGAEAVALWAGVRDGSRFLVRETVVPAQTAYRTPGGLLYRVDSDELHRINVALFHSGLSLAAQVHSHPGEAYHSDTDDAYPIVTVLGGTSIVVPDFAAGPATPELWAVYRLLPDAGWVRLPPGEAATFVEITHDL